MFLVYGGSPEAELRVDCYCDAGFKIDKDDTNSQIGYVFIFNGGAVDWKSSKQRLGILPIINDPIRMLCDNSAALHFASEPGFQKVIGCMTGKDNIERDFNQLFFLAPEEGGYFVLNDIFRYIDNVTCGQDPKVVATPKNYVPKQSALLIKRSHTQMVASECGHPVNGPYCQGCSLLREKLEEDLVTYLKYFQDTFESSDDSTNVVNAPREPVVVKHDHGVNPSHIDKCCCECGNALDGIFCHQCICKSCGKGAHTGYNCPSKVPIISNPEPCNQTMNNELPQTLPSFDSMCHSDKERAMLNMVTTVHLKFCLSIRSRVTVTPLFVKKTLCHNLGISSKHS
uniref:NTF2 domain-containing protein n=1 Tax=Tanacetum cinerariifolium TaxID=118510 RepID=A0A699HYV4_TANCI|nr:hypothetical protein [Tanacetum cinerariifolium]